MVTHFQCDDDSIFLPTLLTCKTLVTVNTAFDVHNGFKIVLKTVDFKLGKNYKSNYITLNIYLIKYH